MLENKLEDVLNIKVFLDKCKPDVLNLIQDSMLSKGSVKFSIELFAEFIKYSMLSGGEEHADLSIKSFKTPMVIAFDTQDIEKTFL